MSFEHVLLPLDGSAFSAAALPTAQALAARFSAQLEIVSVAPDERAADRLRKAVDKSLDGDPAARSMTMIVADDPAEAVSEHATRLGSCLISMSTRGRGRVAGAVIGSVARQIFTATKSPIVAVGPHADRPGGLVGRPRRRPESWPAPLSTPNLVACVDGSEASETVLPEAARWATALHMGLTILTVIEEGTNPGPDAATRFGPADPHSYIQELAARWRATVPDTVGQVLPDPIGVASALQTYLATRPAGLVAVTTHARSGLQRVRLGATAADIVRGSAAPALVVPLPDP